MTAARREIAAPRRMERIVGRLHDSPTGPSSPLPNHTWPARPEARLLLHACSMASAPGAVAPAEALGDPTVDWAWLLQAAERHAVMPLLARHITTRPAGVPPHVLATLRERFDANALRNVGLAARLAELLQQLGDHGVDAMPIKGPSLAISAYGDLSLREFADIDIVVRPGDFDRARALLGEWGYVPLAALTRAGERALRSADHHLALVSQDERVVVELHWTLGHGRLGRDDSWVWSNARPVSILGLEVPTLSWSALLVYLCAHGAGHCWARLGWIRDVAGVLSTAPPGELRGAGELATAACAERRLALGVVLARELLGAPAPEGLRVKSDRAVMPLAANVRSRLFAEGGLELARSLAFQCRTRERMADRAGYCLHLLAAPHVSDVEAIGLPGWLRWTYPVVRPLRLAAKYGWLLLTTGAASGTDGRSTEDR